MRIENELTVFVQWLLETKCKGILLGSAEKKRMIYARNFRGFGNWRIGKYLRSVELCSYEDLRWLQRWLFDGLVGLLTQSQWFIDKAHCAADANADRKSGKIMEGNAPLSSQSYREQCDNVSASSLPKLKQNAGRKHHRLTDYGKQTSLKKEVNTRKPLSVVQW